MKNKEQKTANHLKYGFTLVELIVVIVILAILATIAIISFWSQSSSARDSTRLSDLASIGKWLSIKSTVVWWYPLPDKYLTIKSWTASIWYQWEVWDSVKMIINANKNWFKDPLDGVNYTYSINASKNKFQLLAFLENKASLSLELSPSLSDSTLATTYVNRYPYTKWDNLWILSVNSSWSTYTPLQDTSLTWSTIDITNTWSTVWLVAVISTNPNDGTNNIAWISSSALSWYTSTWTQITWNIFTDDWVTTLTVSWSAWGWFWSWTFTQTAVTWIWAQASIKLYYWYSAPTFTRVWSWDTPSTANVSTTPELWDLDWDWDLDLLQWNWWRTVLAYENTWTSSSPVWTRKAAWDWPTMPLCSQPKLIDMDWDWDLDLYVWYNAYYCWTDNISRPQQAYENTWTSSSPVWTRKAAWDTPAFANVAFWLRDMNSDWLVDLFVVWAHGTWVYAYRNTWTSATPVWTRETTWDFESWVDLWARMAFISFWDLDKDWDIDIIKDHMYIMNKWTPTSPRFANTAEYNAGNWSIPWMWWLVYACWAQQWCPWNWVFWDINWDWKLDAITWWDSWTNWWTYRNDTTYWYSATWSFVSASIDLWINATIKTFSWTETLNWQILSMKVRSSSTSNFTWAPAWSTCTNISNSSDPVNWWCVTSWHRYIQYQVSLSSSNPNNSPSLDSVTINY